MHTCAYGGQRLTSLVTHQNCPPLFMTQGLSLAWDHQLGWPSSKPSYPLFPCPRCWDYKLASVGLAVCVGTEGTTQVLMLVWQPLLTEPCSRDRLAGLLLFLLKIGKLRLRAGNDLPKAQGNGDNRIQHLLQRGEPTETCASPWAEA